MLTNALILKVSGLAGAFVLFAFWFGGTVGRIVLRRQLVRFLLTADATVRAKVKHGDPTALVEAAGRNALAQELVREFVGATHRYQ